MSLLSIKESKKTIITILLTCVLVGVGFQLVAVAPDNDVASVSIPFSSTNITLTQEEQDYINKKPVVYIAGITDLYPIEYYDSKTGTFEGIFPESYRHISRKTGIQFRYLNNDKHSESERMQMATNKQVDILSCINKSISMIIENDFIFSETYFVVPDKQYSSKQLQMCLAYTNIENQFLKSIVDKYLNQITYEDKQLRILDKTMLLTEQYIKTQRNLITVAIITAICITAFIIFLFRHRRYKKSYMALRGMDSLTGYYNFTAFEEMYHSFVTPQNKVHYWLVHFDIGVDKISEIYGREEVRSLLLNVAGIIDKTISKEKNEIFCRMDGDYYVILLKRNNRDDVEALLNEITTQIKKHIINEKKSYDLFWRMGVNGLKEGSDRLDDALRNAMMAQVDHKGKQQYIGFYSEEINRAKSEAIKLEQDLMHAFLNNEFILHIQPYFWMENLKLAGAEALVRWEHPVRGLIKPDKFIPLAEKNNLIDRLDMVVFEECCKLLRDRKNENKPLFWLSVNFSKQSFQNPEFAENISTCAQKYGVSPTNLPIEITEAVQAKDIQFTDIIINTLNKRGFPLIIDNFGGNNTSFDNLCRYPVSIIKLDKTLIDNIEYKNMRITVSGLIKIIHKMGILTMCRGVEQANQSDIIKKLNCDLVQGYYYYQPMSYKDFVREVDKEKIN